MKTSAHQIAVRYVKALFDSTPERERGQVEKDFKALEAALAGSEEFKSLLSNPLLTRDQQATAMAAVLDKLKASKTTGQFIAMLARQQRLVLLPDIIRLFADWAATARGEIAAEIVSAQPLDKKEADAIATRLTKALGKNIVLKMRQDASLLGGVIIKIGSTQLDSSLSGKLRRLQQALKAA